MVVTEWNLTLSIWSYAIGLVLPPLSANTWKGRGDHNTHTCAHVLQPCQCMQGAPISQNLVVTSAAAMHMHAAKRQMPCTRLTLVMAAVSVVFP